MGCQGGGALAVMEWAYVAYWRTVVAFWGDIRGCQHLPHSAEQRNALVPDGLANWHVAFGQRTLRCRASYLPTPSSLQLASGRTGVGGEGWRGQGSSARATATVFYPTPIVRAHVGKVNAGFFYSICVFPTSAASAPQMQIGLWNRNMLCLTADVRSDQ